MLDNLTQRLARVMKTLRGEARLTDDNIADALREVRLALLEADVALPAIKALIAAVKEKAIGEEVIGSLSPGQALIGVVHRELTLLMGEAHQGLNLATQPPAIVLMAGLQGAGKTTTVGKLAKLLRETQNKKVLVVSWWTTGGEAAGFNAIINKFNCDNPQYFVTNSAIAGGAGSVAQAALQNRVLNGNPPDSFQGHMGHELLDTYVTPGYMDNLDDLYAANGWTTQFPQGVLDIVSAKGTDGVTHYYSVPLDIHRANVLWYNKTVFTANNLTAPTTWDQFFTVADALKAKGITPLAVGDNGIWANGMLLEDVLIGQLGADKFDGLWTGTTDWSSPDVTTALTTYQKILTYVNSDHSSLTWDQAADYLIPASAGAQPKAAMTIMGDWAAGEFDNKKFTDYGYVALGLPRNPAIPANAEPGYFDLGLCGPLRTDFLGKKQYCGFFRAPTLRNVALTPPYMATRMPAKPMPAAIVQATRGPLSR